jgi:hypothetical protein
MAQEAKDGRYLFNSRLSVHDVSMNLFHIEWLMSVRFSFAHVLSLFQDTPVHYECLFIAFNPAASKSDVQGTDT